ncbi:DUF2971 domain-containing protein [Phaeobacter sp. J2-8]|uniref:DUF2971 domain-containing protein n=1 Tax=Phaeobacter sp. J2-8 TaxID=2931394 RepID=UPI001FD5D1B0|nr:DUF2971 domain-containing protein [Phaeobacter sp. J2-8]MCJ7872645.1 DUF2971 domain-containing protein [Phaeobacter sp. J2-8]
MSNTVRLFHFTCDHWAAENVKNRRLKLSFPNDVNDIFEFMPFDFGDSEKARSFRTAWKTAIDGYSKSQGFISFSESWAVPTMWGHYANNHKGVCLGFDLPIRRGESIAYADKIRYIDKLRPISERDLADTKYKDQLVNFARMTKSNHWSYEEEWRYWFSLSQTEKELKLTKPNEVFFANFDANLVLREVIFGARSTHTTESFKTLLRETDDVKFTTARPSFRRFAMVTQQLASLNK